MLDQSARHDRDQRLAGLLSMAERTDGIIRISDAVAHGFSEAALRRLTEDIANSTNFLPQNPRAFAANANQNAPSLLFRNQVRPRLLCPSCLINFFKA